MVEAGTNDPVYKSIASDESQNNATLQLPLIESDRIGLSLEPRDVIVVAIEQAGSGFTHRDARLQLRLGSRPASTVNVSVSFETQPSPSTGFLVVIGSGRLEVDPVDWQTPIEFTIRTSPVSVPSSLTSPLRFDNVAQIFLASFDPEYDSAT